MLSLVLLLASTVGGCGGGNDPDAAIAKVNETNMQRLANLYFTFQMKHGWRGPDDEEEFKAFISGYSPRKLNRIGVDPENVDALFVSERDETPFKIRYSVRGSTMGSSEPVIFEAVGKGGSRMVGFLDMVQIEVEEGDYDRYWEGGPRSEVVSVEGRP